MEDDIFVVNTYIFMFVASKWYHVYLCKIMIDIYLYKMIINVYLYRIMVMYIYRKCCKMPWNIDVVCYKFLI